MKTQDTITSGPIVRTVFSLALPVVLGMVMEIALSVVNFFWVGKLGPAAQDAITSSMVVHGGLFDHFNRCHWHYGARLSSYWGEGAGTGKLLYVAGAVARVGALNPDHHCWADFWRLPSEIYEDWSGDNRASSPIPSHILFNTRDVRDL